MLESNLIYKRAKSIGARTLTISENGDHLSALNVSQEITT